jgi:subtilisin family serine protease
MYASAGIWPESRSFDDSGYGYGPVPKRWKGVCQTGQAFNASNCNRKVIGARWYAADVSEEDLKNEYRSPRDANGHGTHTASTIAGSPVRNASHHGGGLAAGIARGWQYTRPVTLSAAARAAATPRSSRPSTPPLGMAST